MRSVANASAKFSRFKQRASVHPGSRPCPSSRWEAGTGTAARPCARPTAPSGSDTETRLERARGAGHQLERRLHLRAIGFLGPEFRRIDHGLQNAANVAAGRSYSFAMRSIKRLRRIVGNEVARQFGGNEMRSVRIVRQHLERFFAVFLAAVVEGVAHHDFLALGVEFRTEHEFGIAPRLANGPAGESIGHFDHVLLRVARIDADGVQLHHFAAVVFVQAALLLLLPAAVRREAIAPRARNIRRSAQAAAKSSLIARGGASHLRCRLLEGYPDRRSASCRERRASPDSSRWPAARS